MDHDLVFKAENRGTKFVGLKLFGEGDKDLLGRVIINLESLQPSIPKEFSVNIKRAQISSPRIFSSKIIMVPLTMDFTAPPSFRTFKFA